MSIEIRFASETSPDYDYSIGFPGATRTEAEEILNKLYKENPNWQKKYLSVNLADIPNETVLNSLADILRDVGAARAWINSWQHGPSENMVISVEGDKTSIVQYDHPDEVLPLGVQFEKRDQ
jgi:hypothetical protein